MSLTAKPLALYFFLTIREHLIHSCGYAYICHINKYWGRWLEGSPPFIKCRLDFIRFFYLRQSYISPSSEHMAQCICLVTDRQTSSVVVLVLNQNVTLCRLLHLLSPRTGSVDTWTHFDSITHYIWSLTSYAFWKRTEFHSSLNFMTYIVIWSLDTSYNLFTFPSLK